MPWLKKASSLRSTKTATSPSSRARSPFPSSSTRKTRTSSLWSAPSKWTTWISWELFYSAASEASREYRIAKAYIGEIEDECFEIRFCVEGLATPELFRSNLRRYVELLLDMQESVFDACEEDDSDAE